MGEWCGRIPYGFKIDGKHLAEDQDQRILIQKAKRMKRNGKSIRAIAKELNVSIGLAHKLTTTNCRSKKGYEFIPRNSKKYSQSNGLDCSGVQEGGPL